VRLNINGGSPATNIVATAIGVGGMTTIVVDSLANVTGTTTIPLISYSGADPFAHLALAPLPAGYTGNLVDNAANQRIDLNVASTATPPSPVILPPTISGTNLTLQTASQSGFNYVLEGTSQLAPANWYGVQTNPGGGTVSFSVPISLLNSNQFFRLRVE
jgi:hypothetical protein